MICIANVFSSLSFAFLILLGVCVLGESGHAEVWGFM